jgi:hypothetical protein
MTLSAVVINGAIFEGVGSLLPLTEPNRRLSRLTEEQLGLNWTVPTLVDTGKVKRDS